MAFLEDFLIQAFETEGASLWAWVNANVDPLVSASARHGHR